MLTYFFEREYWYNKNMWQIDDLIHYSLLLGFYVSIGVAAMLGRKTRNYFLLNFTSKGIIFLLLTIISYGTVYFLLYKLSKGFNFWFYFGAISVSVGLITHLLLPLERWSKGFRGKT